MSIADQLDALLEQGEETHGREAFRSGLTLAKVTNIKDDQNFNRVKCLPIGAEEAEETDWCYVMTPMGGKECGMFFFPQVGDLVVLAYLEGDMHCPMVLGGFWNTEVTPPYPVKDGKIEDYSIRTPKKIELLLHDEDKKQKVTLTMPSGTVLTLDDEAQKVTLQDKGGDNALIMDLKGGEITLQAKTTLTLSAGQTKIVLSSQGDITQKGNGTVSTEGVNVKTKATSQLEMEGAMAKLKASATMDLQSSGTATLKGSIVQIN